MALNSINFINYVHAYHFVLSEARQHLEEGGSFYWINQSELVIVHSQVFVLKGKLSFFSPQTGILIASVQ